MFEPREHENVFLHVLRWTARAASVVCLAIIFLFFLSEGINFGEIAPREWIGLLFFPVGVFIGLVLAWREEGLGGGIALGSVLGFYLIYGWLFSGKFWQGWAVLPFLLPAVLFLAYWFFSSLSLSHKKENLSR